MCSKLAIAKKGVEMNKIQNYGINNISSNYQQAKCDKVSNIINFKALHMPPKDEFVKLGEKCVQELETVRPNIIKLAKENPEVECFVEPRRFMGGDLQIAATCVKGKAHFPIDVKEEMEYAKQQSKTFGEHVVDLLKGAIEDAKSGAI